MNKTTKVIVGFAAVVIIASVGFMGGFAAAHLDSVYIGAASGATSPLAAKIAEVDSLLQAQALVPPNEASATAGAVQGLLSATGDKYAMYFNKKMFAAFNEQTMGSFGGIGVVLGENKKGQAYVVEVYKGTPAYKVGMKAGDIFHSIEGTTQVKWSTDDIVRLVRGPKGTKVHLVMTRPSTNPSKPSKDIPFTITRDQINYPNTKTEMFGDVGYVRLAEFNANSAGDMEKAIKEVTGKGAKSLILDLRDNPGGLLDEAVDVSSLFIADGVIVRVDQRGVPEEIHNATGHKITDLPMVVLVDGESASASEITAGALQDYGRATLVGEKSYGKGSVQTIEKLSDGSGVKFTIAHYLTPKKRSINGVGLTPDYVVVMDPLKQLDKKTDTQLAKAIQIAKSKAK